VIEAKGKRTFVGGDSGYADHFRQIGELLKALTIASSALALTNPNGLCTQCINHLQMR